MLRFISAGVFVLAAAGMLWMPSPSRPAHAPKTPVVEVGGGCGCAKGLRCCFDCSGHPLCVTSFNHCPECPAP